jgi:F-type H+-transporting ATPase subunit c
MMKPRAQLPKTVMRASASSDLFNNSAVMRMGGVRHAGASAIAAGAAAVAFGGVAQGIGSVFAALVVGSARNPAMKDDLFGLTMIGFGMVEIIAFAVAGFAGLLYVSE